MKILIGIVFAILLAVNIFSLYSLQAEKSELKEIREALEKAQIEKVNLENQIGNYTESKNETDNDYELINAFSESIQEKDKKIQDLKNELGNKTSSKNSRTRIVYLPSPTY